MGYWGPQDLGRKPFPWWAKTSPKLGGAIWPGFGNVSHRSSTLCLICRPLNVPLPLSFLDFGKYDARAVVPGQQDQDLGWPTLLELDPGGMVQYDARAVEVYFYSLLSCVWALCIILSYYSHP